MMSNILLIDDSNVDRLLIRKLLEQNFNNVCIFESDDGKNIEEFVVSNGIKVVILDLLMPEIDGINLLEALKNNEKTMDVPVIVCSSISDQFTLGKVLSIGAYDYFSKPLSAEVMKIILPLKIRNAIEIKNRAEDIEDLSNKDYLTGLFNRHYMKKELVSRSVEMMTMNSIIMADINGLKVVNDAYGSEFGDKYLVAASQTITQIFNKSLNCRWGGDEFLMLCYETSEVKLQKKINDAKDLFLEHGDNEIGLTISFGVSIQTKLDQNIFKVLTIAEDAMFRDKVLEHVSVRSTLINTVLKTLHEKNKREEAHSRRVSELCEEMGNVLNLAKNQVKDLKIIGLVHDIGKTAIEEVILSKPGKLTHDEWCEMKRHPEIGYRILSTSKELQSYADVVLCHHEHINGKGYPNGLSGKEIPYYSKILSICDSYDAMTVDRTYRSTMTEEEAAIELINNIDDQFDAELVEVFVTKIVKLGGYFEKEL